MKHFLIIFIVCSFFSCKTDTIYQSIANLPDNELINEAILNVIKYDSLDQSCGISKNLIIPHLYVINSNDTLRLYPDVDFSYDDLYYYFCSFDTVEKRLKDSIFIAQQIDSINKNFISEDILKNFSGTKKGSYHFFLPIFSHNKELVIVLYEKRFGSLFDYSAFTLLKKTSYGWIKVDGFCLGTS